VSNIGKFIKGLREKKGFSQRQLAYLSGVSNTEISRIENGERKKPDIEILQKIARPLGVNYKTLYVVAGYVKNEDNIDGKIKSAISDDPELLEFWNEMTERDNLQILLKQVKDLPDESIKRIIRYIKIVEDEEALEDN